MISIIISHTIIQYYKRHLRFVLSVSVVVVVAVDSKSRKTLNKKEAVDLDNLPFDIDFYRDIALIDVTIVQYPQYSE